MCVDEQVTFQRVCSCLRLKSREGREEGVFQGTNVDPAGRQRTTHTRTQHHPEPPPPPPPLCGMAIIKMIYLTIGPRLRD